MNKSTISIDVVTDENRVPEKILWSATDTSAENAQKAKAMMLSFWDGGEKDVMQNRRQFEWELLVSKEIW